MKGKIMMEENKKFEQQEQCKRMAVGIGVGLPLGAAMGNIALGLVLGIAIGGLGAILRRKR